MYNFFIGDDRVFVWGRCDYGQLGLPGWCQSDKHRCCWQPVELPQLKNAKQVRRSEITLTLMYSAYATFQTLKLKLMPTNIHNYICVGTFSKSGMLSK